MQVNEKLCDKRPKIVYNDYISNLPDELVVAILSCLTLKESARTSVLSHKWRYQWQFTSGTLDFDYTANRRKKMEHEEFVAWVNCVLKLHQGSQVENMIISFRHHETQSIDIDSWIDFAIQKKVKRFELNLSDGFSPNAELNYVFPDLDKLLLRSQESKCFFLFLKSLRLVSVNVIDDVVHYFLALCPFLEQLCLNDSGCTKNLKVVDPLPSLKHLEISDCDQIQNLEISVSTLVSVKYNGPAIHVPFKKVPNLSELRLAGKYCEDFMFEPNKHYSYSVGLEKLVLEFTAKRSQREIRVPPVFPRLCSLKQLELAITTISGRRLLFFLSFIKSFPLLHSLKIKVAMLWSSHEEFIVYPDVKAVDIAGFYFNHLKVVEITGNIGGRNGVIQLLLQLLKIAPSLEMIVMDCRHPGLVYADMKKTVASARRRINELRHKLPSRIQLIER